MLAARSTPLFRGPSMPSPDPSSSAAPLDADTLVASLQPQGHVFVEGARMQAFLERCGELADWPAFAASWNDLPVDLHMADGGRYRRRRYAVLHADREGEPRLQAHQPHYQSLEYNRLNGGVARWFEPLAQDIAGGASLRTILGCCREVFGALAPQTMHWHIEVHQFRIEAVSGQDAQPTPEGVHRDGVDYVLVLLIDRHNLHSGTTTIHTPDGRLLGSFTLTRPFDATLIDDARVYHGVTPVHPASEGAPAYRDVLVVTFRAQRDA